MLVKNRLLFVKTEKHEFDTLIKELEDDFLVSTCKCSYPDIRFHTDDFQADMVICSFKAFKESNIIEHMEHMPDMFIFYSECDSEEMSKLKEAGLNYFSCEYKMFDQGETFIRAICEKLPFRYAEFREKINRIIYDCNMGFRPRTCRAGFSYAVESIRYILFSECNRLSFSGDVYTYLSKKYDTSITGVDNAMRRYVNTVWMNREAMKEKEFFPECATRDERPLVSDFIFELCDRIFYTYRRDFYRYFDAIHK